MCACVWSETRPGFLSHRNWPFSYLISLRGFKGEEVLRGEVTCPQSGNSNLSLSDFRALPSLQQSHRRNKVGPLSRRLLRDKILSPGAWAPAPGWRGRGPDAA